MTGHRGTGVPDAGSGSAAKPTAVDVKPNDTPEHAGAAASEHLQKERTRSSKVPARRALRALVTTWRGKLIATIGFAAVVVSLVNGMIPIVMFFESRTAPTVDATMLDSALALSVTPAVGHASKGLGYGDAAGGRSTITYLGTEPTPDTPVLNSFVDIPYGIDSDEREFMRLVSMVSPTDYTGNGDRYVRELATSQTRNYVGLNLLMDNNATPLRDCTRLSGTAVANDLHLRIALWDSPRKDEHVMRSWLVSTNASPEWITDAVLINTPPNRTLTFVSGGIYRKLPRVVAGTPLSREILRPGGALVGDGLLGSCWDNRTYAFIVFRVSAAETSDGR